MKRLTAIVAMDHHGAIGAGGMIPWRLETDTRLFQQATTGKVVIMGRKTFESLGSRPLADRTTIILSHNRDLKSDSPECRVVHSAGEALEAAWKAADGDECFLAGGAAIYDQFAPFVDRYLITLVDQVVADADSYFNVGLFSSGSWQIAQHSAVAASETDEIGFTLFDLQPDDALAIADLREAKVTEYREEATRRTLARVMASLRRSSGEQAIPAAAMLSRVATGVERYTRA